MGELVDITEHLNARAARVAKQRRKRDAQGRYEAECDVGEMLEKLRRVAEHAQRTQPSRKRKRRFTHPWDVTERAWEQAANDLEPELGWLGKPNGIVRQLRRVTGKQWSWEVWLYRAFHIDDPDKFEESLTRRPERETDQGDALRSMLLITAKLGEAPAGKPDYDRAYRMLLEEAAVSGRLAYAREQLLDSERVLIICGSWDNARALISAPPLGPSDTVRRASPIAELGAYYYARKGVLPLSTWLRAFAREEDFAFENAAIRSWSKSIGPIRERIAELVAERGWPEPPPYGTKPSPDWVPLEYEFEGRRRARRTNTRDDAKRSLVAYTNWLNARNNALPAKRRRLTVSNRSYREFSTGNRDVLSLNTIIDNFGPLKPLLVEACRENKMPLPPDLRSRRGRVVQLRGATTSRA